MYGATPLPSCQAEYFFVLCMNVCMGVYFKVLYTYECVWIVLCVPVRVYISACMCGSQRSILDVCREMSALLFVTGSLTRT